MEEEMRTQYEYGKGLMIFVPPTESELAVALVTLIVERVEERGGDAEQFREVIESIIDNRSKIQ